MTCQGLGQPVVETDPVPIRAGGPVGVGKRVGQRRHLTRVGIHRDTQAQRGSEIRGAGMVCHQRTDPLRPTRPVQVASAGAPVLLRFVLLLPTNFPSGMRCQTVAGPHLRDQRIRALNLDFPDRHHRSTIKAGLSLPIALGSRRAREGLSVRTPVIWMLMTLWLDSACGSLTACNLSPWIPLVRPTHPRRPKPVALGGPGGGWQSASSFWLGSPGRCESGRAIAVYGPTKSTSL